MSRVWNHKVLVITDTHLTAGDRQIIGLDPTARAQAALDHALAHHGDADALILMGDLAHHGEVQAYDVLFGILKAAPMPVVPMLGNHDQREAFREVFVGAPESPGGFVQSVVTFDGWRVLTLDTLDGPPYRDGHHAGRLCADRLAWLDAELARAGDEQLLVCSHHPPHDVGFPGMDRIRLVDGAELLGRLRANGRAHLLCGHVHRTISGSSHGVPWSMLKSPCHQAPLDLGDPDTSLSVDEVGAYGVVLLGPGGAIVHTEDVTCASAAIERDPTSA